MKKKILETVSIVAMFLMVFTIFPKQIFADNGEKEIILGIVHDLVTDPACELLHKDNLPNRLYTIEDSTGKKYFCLTQSLGYPNGEKYKIDDTSEVVSDDVRWLVYNYNNNPSYFDGYNDETAYGATQIAVWYYTRGGGTLRNYETDNALIIRLINDAEDKQFPSLSEILSGYSATVPITNELTLVNNRYTGSFSTKITGDEGNMYGTASISSEKVTIQKNGVDITDDSGVTVTKVSGNNYTLAIDSSLITAGDVIIVHYAVGLEGTTEIVLDAAPEDVEKQRVGFTQEKIVSKTLNAFNTFAIGDPEGKVQVTKVDENNNPLPNAEFTLTDNLNNVMTATTDQNGLATFDIEPNKMYTLEETKNPQGYKGTFKQENITLVNDGDIFTYTAENQIKTGTIQVAKYSEGSAVLQDAEFTLTDNDGNAVVATTDQNGLASFAIEANKTYTLEETKNPEGYKGTFKEEGITLANDGQIFEFEAINQIKQGQIEVTKLDQNNMPLQNAEFTLTDNDGNKIVNTTNTDGLASFDIEANKTYTLEETKNPQGYKGSFKEENITLANDGEIFSYTANNEIKRGKVQVTKKDPANLLLQNAEFTLTDSSGNKVVARTDANGLASFDIEANKTYTLEETKNPQGYNGTFKKEGITLANDGEIFEYTAINYLNRGKVQVTKVNQNNAPLQNAEFTLTDNDGHKVTAISDKDGLATFDIEVNKTYILEETKNPEGYHGSFRLENITLADNGQIFKYNVVNTATPTANPKTGDTHNILVPSIVLLSSAVLLSAAVVYYFKRKKNVS